MNTTKLTDSIVNSYDPNGDGITTGKLNIIDAKEISIKLTQPTKSLTVNVDFPNSIGDNPSDYQDMTITVSGADLSEPIVRKLGTDGVKLKNNSYRTSISLTQNNAYTVTVSGAGYRTARYTVSMTGAKTLNFWNNVKDEPTVIEKGSTGTEVKTNFLAGDIVKDGQINIYDLSAVVSYFGTNGLSASNHPEYAKYDLNRDGVIDSMDVAYVLVSWGN